jgi:hypothetical protein
VNHARELVWLNGSPAAASALKVPAFIELREKLRSCIRNNHASMINCKR